MEGPALPIINGMERRADESGIILTWFLKVGVLLAVIAVVGFDVGSIIVNNVSLASSAEDIAIAVSITVDENNNPNVPDFTIYAMAKEEVADEANGVAGARVMQKGTSLDEAGVVHVRLRRKADTLITRFIGPLKKYTIATVDGQAGT